MTTNIRIRTERFVGDVWECCRLFSASVTGGCRTELRNQSVGGQTGSKHTQEGGWGLGIDLWFDSSVQREPAITWLKARGWSVYIGDDYAPQRLHTQAFAYGERPPAIEEVQA